MAVLSISVSIHFDYICSLQQRLELQDGEGLNAADAVQRANNGVLQPIENRQPAPNLNNEDNNEGVLINERPFTTVSFMLYTLNVKIDFLPFILILTLIKFMVEGAERVPAKNSQRQNHSKILSIECS